MPRFPPSRLVRRLPAWRRHVAPLLRLRAGIAQPLTTTVLSCSTASVNLAASIPASNSRCKGWIRFPKSRRCAGSLSTPASSSRGRGGLRALQAARADAHWVGVPRYCNDSSIRSRRSRQRVAARATRRERKTDPARRRSRWPITSVCFPCHSRASFDRLLSEKLAHGTIGL